jgi:ABC-type transporter Mla subunit MlaD
MADVGGFKEALSGLSALLPRLPEALAALADAQAALTESAEHFLATVEAQQVEAAELFPRLEVALAGIGREAADGLAQAEQDRDVEEILGDPGLGFDDKVLQFSVLVAQKQEERLRQMAHALDTSRETVAGIESARQSLRDGMTDGKTVVATSADASLAAAQALQSVVEAARGTVGTDVEQLGTEMDSQHTNQGRELENLRRDVDGHEAGFVERIDRAREVVRQDTDRLVDNLKDRLDDLTSTLGRSLNNLRDSLRELDENVREAAEDGGHGRESLSPYFEELEHMLPALKQVLDQVREAAAMVGIPF